jgi:sister chromatid cohesion protein DCC1
MYLVSLSLLYNAASVLELFRSLESEHEVRREVTSQVMGWFGQVDDTDEQRKMDVEKVVRQVGLGILRQYKVSFSERFFLPALIPRLILTCFWLVLYLQSDPISEDEFVTKWNAAVGDPFVSNTSLKLLTVRVVTSFGFGALYNGYEIGKLPLRTFSPLSSSNTLISYFPCAELP